MFGQPILVALVGGFAMNDPRQTTHRPIRKKVALQDGGLLLGIPEIPAPDYGSMIQEYEQIDCRQFDAAIQALGKLTGDEADMLSVFACLVSADTPEKRSWRARLFHALEEILKLDTQHLGFVVAYARGVGTADKFGCEPLSPFIDITPSLPIPSGE